MNKWHTSSSPNTCQKFGTGNLDEHIWTLHAFGNLAEKITQTPVEQSPAGWRCLPTFETETRPGDGRCDLHLLHLDVMSFAKMKLQDSYRPLCRKNYYVVRICELVSLSQVAPWDLLGDPSGASQTRNSLIPVDPWVKTQVRQSIHTPRIQLEPIYTA